VPWHEKNVTSSTIVSTPTDVPMAQALQRKFLAHFKEAAIDSILVAKGCNRSRDQEKTSILSMDNQKHIIIENYGKKKK
jgi:hypothetical protein